MTTNFNSIYNLGYLSSKLPYELFIKLKEETQRMADNNFKGCTPYGSNLAGVIQHEYTLDNHTTELLQFINEIIPSYFANWPDEFSQPYPRVKYVKNEKAIWVNFQKKYEYNPIHFHQGVWSFVLWVNIPYDMEEEDRQRKTGTRFTFHYPDMLLGGLGAHPIKVDKAFEGRIIIFPALLHHSVTPFYTSDGYRVSISGNLMLANNG